MFTDEEDGAHYSRKRSNRYLRCSVLRLCCVKRGVNRIRKKSEVSLMRSQEDENWLSTWWFVAVCGDVEATIFPSACSKLPPVLPGPLPARPLLTQLLLSGRVLLAPRRICCDFGCFWQPFGVQWGHPGSWSVCWRRPASPRRGKPTIRGETQRESPDASPSWKPARTSGVMAHFVPLEAGLSQAGPFSNLPALAHRVRDRALSASARI